MCRACDEMERAENEVVERRALLADVIDTLWKLEKLELDDFPGFRAGEWSRRNLEAIAADMRHALGD